MAGPRAPALLELWVVGPLAGRVALWLFTTEARPGIFGAYAKGRVPAPTRWR